VSGPSKPRTCLPKGGILLLGADVALRPAGTYENRGNTATLCGRRPKPKKVYIEPSKAAGNPVSKESGPARQTTAISVKLDYPRSNSSARWNSARIYLAKGDTDEARALVSRKQEKSGRPGGRADMLSESLMENAAKIGEKIRIWLCAAVPSHAAPRWGTPGRGRLVKCLKHVGHIATQAGIGWEQRR